MSFRCKYCTALLPTAQGLCSHIAQSSRCQRNAYNEFQQREHSPPSKAHTPPSEPEAMSDDDDLPNADFDLPRMPSPAEEDKEEPPSKRARVEEIEDEEAPGKTRWTEPFPFPAGTILGRAPTRFEAVRAEQTASGDAPWAPFESEDEWELVRWMMQSGISQKQTDKFLKLKKVCLSSMMSMM